MWELVVYDVGRGVPRVVLVLGVGGGVVGVSGVTAVPRVVLFDVVPSGTTMSSVEHTIVCPVRFFSWGSVNLCGGY